MDSFMKDGNKNKKYRVYVDNPPQWNASKNVKLTFVETSTYVYDFKGRVTMPSIKNFQMVPEADGRTGNTLGEFLLQFGKNGKDSFICDVQFPLSIF